MRPSSRSGLTVIELLIIIVIICILAVIVWPRLRSRENGPAAAARVVRVAGPDSTVAAADSAEVVVRVDGADGRPMRGVPVNFEVASGVGSVEPASAQSDSAGLVSVIWRFGADSGVNRLTARLRDRADARVELTTRAMLAGGRR